MIFKFEGVLERSAISNQDSDEKDYDDDSDDESIDDDVGATESHTSPHGASLEVSALNISVRKQDPRQQT